MILVDIIVVAPFITFLYFVLDLGSYGQKRLGSIQVFDGSAYTLRRHGPLTVCVRRCGKQLKKLLSFVLQQCWLVESAMT